MHILIQQPGHTAYEVEVTNRLELMDLALRPRWVSISGSEHVSMQLAPGTTITILEDDR